MTVNTSVNSLGMAISGAMMAIFFGCDLRLRAKLRNLREIDISSKKR